MKSYAFVFIFCGLVYYFFIHRHAPTPVRVGSAPRFRLAPSTDSEKNSGRTLASLVKKQEATQASSAVVEEKNSHPEIMAFIRNNDACGLMAFMDARTNSVSALADVFIDQTHLEHLRNIIGSQGVLYKDIEAKTEQEKFFQALALGGLNYHMEGQVDNDAEKALEKFSELGRQNPSNAAYLFMKVTLQEKMGQTPQQIKETLKGLAATRNFDMYQTKIKQQIHEHAWDSAAMFVAARYMGAFVPGFSLYSGSQTISNLGEESDRNHLAELMTTEGRMAVKDLSSFGFSPGLYGTGVALAAPGTYSDLSELMESKPHPKPDALDNEPTWDVENCNQESFDEYVKTYRNSY